MDTDAARSNLSVPKMVVPAHNLARWIHATMDVTDGLMRWESRRTLLGIVPIGWRRVEIPAADVDSLRVRRTVRPTNLLLGLAMMVFPILAGWGWWLLLTLPAGTWVVLVSLGPRMEAETHGGRTHHVDVCFGHQIDAELYMSAVEDIGAEARSRPGDPM
jgi:hypothetical protein